VEENGCIIKSMRLIALLIAITTDFFALQHCFVSKNHAVSQFFMASVSSFETVFQADSG